MIAYASNQLQFTESSL